MSDDLQRENTDLQAEASALRQLATELVRELRIARSDAYGTDHAETADVFDLAASILDNRRAGQPLLEEVARLRAQLADLSRQIGEQNTTIGYQDAMLAQLKGALQTAYHALMSYTHGNGAPDLAAEVAAHILAVIEERARE